MKKKLKPITCPKCGETYIPRVKNPKACSRCKQQFNRPTVLKKKPTKA